MKVSRRQRLILTEHSRPVLARQARLRFDEVRECWIILAPERVLAPDEIAVEVLKLCDGERELAAIIDLLAEKYEADRSVIRDDVIAMLQDLADKSFLSDRRPTLAGGDTDG